MAMVNVGHIVIPPHFSGLQANSADTSTSLQLDASGERIAVVIKCQKAGTLHKVHFKTGTVVQDQTLRVSFQDLDASGDADLTEDQYRDVAILGTDDATNFTTGILSSDGTDGGSKRTVAVGDWLAIVFRITDFAASDIFRLRSFTSTNPAGANAYTELYTGTWAKSATVITPIILEFSDGTLMPIVDLLACSDVATTNLANSTNPVRQGCKFRLPFACTILGFRLMGTWAAGSEPSMALYGSDGKTLDTSCNPANDDADASSTAASVTYRTYYLSSAKSMAKDTDFYVYAFNNVATTFSYRKGTYMAANHAAANFPMFTTFQFASQHSTNDPTVTGTNFSPIQLILSQIDDGTGSGGSGNNANMGQFNGGFN